LNRSKCLFVEVDGARGVTTNQVRGKGVVAIRDGFHGHGVGLQRECLKISGELTPEVGAIVSMDD
jgi:hypothetical protein